MREAFIGVDMGGGSGRVMAGTIAGGCLTLTEVHRFSNRMVRLGDCTYWDFPALFADMMAGLRKAAANFRILSIGVDTWGVDFGLIDDCGNLLSNPVSYRDTGVEGAAHEFFSKYSSPRTLYSIAGIQIMDINSVFRLERMKKGAPAILRVADRLLFMPDLFSYFLTGIAANEYTIASTSGLIDARKRDWNRDLIRAMGLPEHIFGTIVQPGTMRGTLTEDVKRQIGVNYDIGVVATASHDTASAVFTAGDGYASDGTAFLSSGTWSLLGVVLDEPLLTMEAMEAGFTNEGGVDGKIRFLQNITGLWILQNLIAQWHEPGGDPVDYGQLIREAEISEYSGIVDVDNPVFHNPAEMSLAIDEYCKNYGFDVPDSRGDYVRCVLLSLAARYKKGIEALNSMLPAPVRRIHIIGGGSRNTLLNSLTESATGLPVTAGAPEATAIGNILVQARAGGKIESPDEIIKIIELN